MPDQPGVPRRVCVCGEFLPHACAPVITVRRQRWTGKRIITITDPDPEVQLEAEGSAERAGVERTGKPGRPAHLWRLTEAGRKTPDA